MTRKYVLTCSQINKQIVGGAKEGKIISFV